ncbi:MAG TPA: hypothetical protein DCY85_02615 [Firmicutes bacterium]|jgi:trk system potassium uptake protein TrkA|nr:hypothetical protein [Bacillota bacterium]HBG44416.1 hypothetical protein [Bacillota bacterium]HBL68464.1 hypothetical protein [Bacillota bacterium]HBR24438.1 hypothetical protein [Bacillota bacterium]HCF89118.1 hypothetical protein [Bacillota bacterium]
MKQNFVVIGLGRFGSSVARTLLEKGHEVLAIEKDEALVNSYSHGFTHLVQADTTDMNVLKSVGVRNCDVAVVAIGSDIQASIMTTLNLKELGIDYIVAKAINSMHGKVLEKIGADRVVYPEMEMGERIANSLVSKSLLDYIELTPEVSIREILVERGFGEKSLSELGLRGRFHVTIVLIKRNDEISITPGGDACIKAGDVLFVIGRNGDLDRFEQQVSG